MQYQDQFPLTDFLLRTVLGIRLLLDAAKLWANPPPTPQHQISGNETTTATDDGPTNCHQSIVRKTFAAHMFAMPFGFGGHVRSSTPSASVP